MVHIATPTAIPWVHEAVVVRESSHSRSGLFANAALEEDTVVLGLRGRLVGTDELRRLLGVRVSE